MYLQRIFGKNVTKLSDLNSVPNIDSAYLAYIDSIMEKDYKENIGKDAEYIDKFYSGKQWINGMEGNSTSAYNAKSQPIWHDEILSTYGSDAISSKPKLTVNLLKDAFETLAAMFCAIDPKAHAVPENPEHYNEDLLRKLNIVSDMLFYEENNFKILYNLLIKEQLKHRQGFIFIRWNEKDAKTPIPVTWEFIEACNIRVDPSATDLNKANFIKHKFKMKYGELKYKYKMDATKTNIEETSDIEVSHYWFKVRFKADEKYQQLKEKTNYWVMIPVYDGKLLRALDEDGKPKDVIVYPYLPFVCFRCAPTQFWYGDQYVSDLIPLNMEYNLVESEEDWNFRKFIDKPLMGNLSPDKFEDIKNHGTFTQLDNLETVRTLDGIEIISSSEFAVRKQTILQNFYRVIGNMAVFQGQVPQRVSSGKMLETMKESAELKPNQMEERNFDSMKELYLKSLLCIDDNNPAGINIFDPFLESGRYEEDGTPIYGLIVKLTSDDIKNSMWTIDIEIDDAKLLSNKEKFQHLVDLMQYGNIAQLIPASAILNMVNGTINGLIDKNIIKSQEKKERDLLNPPPPPEQEIPQQETGIDPETFKNEIDNIAMEMKNNNVPEEVIANILLKSGVDENYNITNGNPPEQILHDLKMELSNKAQDIFNR